MSTTPPIIHWRMMCITEAAYVYTWGPVAPTLCPNNSAHTVDLTSIAAVDTITNTTVYVHEENIQTNGNFQSFCYAIQATGPTGTVYSGSFSLPYPFVIYDVNYVTNACHQGDFLTVQAAPNTTIGALGADAAAGTTTFTVSPTVFAYVNPGYFITLTDGTNTDNLGYLISMNTTTSTITVQTANVHAFAAATPTYVQMTVVMINNMEIGPAWQYSINQRKIGGASVPAGTPINIVYTNNGLNPKRLILKVEITY